MFLFNRKKKKGTRCPFIRSHLTKLRTKKKKTVKPNGPFFTFYFLKNPSLPLVCAF